LVKITSYDPAQVPNPLGGYRQALEVQGDHRQVFISGQIPEDVDGNVPKDFEGQCTQVWRNIFAILDAAGLTAANLVKVTTFLTSAGQADVNGAIRRKFLGDHRPALTVVVVQTLDPKWLLEIEAIAVAPV
jgi:2-iminobutanoate/2-iminopropanoate deaminase